MKKRLLITSIVMMLVCAVALSTATYAWFTSNTSVTAGLVTLRAATSDGSALGIGWVDMQAGTQISTSINEVLQPMAPEIKRGATVVSLQNGVTTYENAGAGQKFYSATVKEESGEKQFNSSGDLVNAVIYESDTYNKQAFYISNLSAANVLDYVTVSAEYTHIEGNYIFVPTNTRIAPDDDTVYYVNGYTNTETGAVIKAQEGHLGAFDPKKTYYERLERYVKTNDIVMQEDTDYYTKDGENYVKVDPRTPGVATGATAEAPSNTYYEMRNRSGDDMLRIALFTREFRFTADEEPVAGKTYYTIDPSTNKRAAVSNPTGNPKQKKYYEVTPRYIPTLDTTAVDGTTYYQLSQGEYTVVNNLTAGTSPVSDYYEKVAETSHVLLGVLGQECTKFAYVDKANVTCDMNEVYYTVTFAAKTVNADTFATAIARGLYTKSGDVYTAVAKGTEYSEGTYYVVSGYTQVDLNGTYGDATYYTASNTVVNGHIQLNKPVNELDYYADVVESIDFAQALRSYEQVEFIAVAWLDGTVLDDTRSNQYAQFSLKFDTNRDSHVNDNNVPSNSNDNG